MIQIPGGPIVAGFLPDAKIKYKEHGVDPRNYRVDFGKIKSRLHFEPNWTVTEGITELIAALQKGLFNDVSSNKNNYGNYEIDYKG